MLKVIITGGTIDATRIMKYREYKFTKSYVQEFIERQCSYCLDVEFKELFLKDSTTLNYLDRIEIVEEIEKSHQDFILISHGTDTMVETAKFINRKVKNKKIVMVGSMTPMAIDPRESCFNLGFAIAKLTSTRKNGVYIAMNSKLFKHNNVIKNKQLQCFEELK